MKNLIIFIFLLFIFCVQAFAQNSSACPTVSIAPHDELIKYGTNAIFTAKITGLESKDIVYKWTVSVEKIIEGQGTSSIKVDTIGLDGQSITAIVEIGGFPANCQNTVAQTATVEPRIICDPGKIDEYEKILFRKEKIRLDNVAVALKENIDTRAFFVFFVSKNEHIQELKRHQANILKYLVEKHKVPKDRFEFVYGGYGEYKTEIWLRPAIPCKI